MIYMMMVVMLPVQEEY